MHQVFQDDTDSARIDRILSEYDRDARLLQDFEREIERRIRALLERHQLRVSTLAVRVKKRESLKRKVTRKRKYSSLFDVTDLVGARIITYYTDHADKAAKLVRDHFSCDWKNSEDKRDRLRVEQFGYRSDHYIVQLPDREAIAFSGLRAEIQIRTILQHAWAEIEHDELGYHADSIVPAEVRRKLARAAAILEGVDEEFRELRTLVKKRSLPIVRAEGFTESLSEIEFSIDPKRLEFPGSLDDITMFFTCNLTTSTGAEQEALLIVEDAALSNPVRGEITAANAVRFRHAFPRYITEGLRHVRCRVRGLRVNANQLGVSQALKPTFISCSVIPHFADGELDSNRILWEGRVASVWPGLISGFHSNQNNSTEEPLRLGLQFREGFPGAFKNDREETAGGRRSQCGTRFQAHFPNVPEAFEVWVTTQDVNYEFAVETFSTSAHLINPESKGAVPSERLTGESMINDPLFGEVQIAKARRKGTNVLAVWEFAADTNLTDCRRELVFWAYVRRSGWPDDKIACRLSLVPESFVTTASPDQPVPRFAFVSEVKYIYLK